MGMSATLDCRSFGDFLDPLVGRRMSSRCAAVVGAAEGAEVPSRDRAGSRRAGGPSLSLRSMSCSRGRVRCGKVKDPISEPMAVKLAVGPTVDDGIQFGSARGEGCVSCAR